MSDFKAKMHQIQIRLGLRPRHRWGDYIIIIIIIIITGIFRVA